MSQYDITTPVALVIFKRTGTARRVLDAIRRAVPPELYVIGDGPRPEVDGEAEAVHETRELVESAVDWDCELHTHYAEDNMGGPERIPSGIDWVFEHTDRAIILEDDFLPDVTFFRYCDELLERYAGTDEVMHIGGNNAGVPPDVDTSYFLSWLTRTSGWATWRDAWQQFDTDLTAWPDLRKRAVLEERFETETMVEAHRDMFDALHHGDRNNWDSIWQYTILTNDGYTALPSRNLVRHIGYGPAAQHNTDKPYLMRLVLPDTSRLSFPLSHPSGRVDEPAFERNLREYKHGWKTRNFKRADRVINRLL